MEQLDLCSRHRIRYEAEPGRWVEAFLLRPLKNDPQKPAIVAFHPTTAETMNVVAGTGGREEQHIGLRLAERGFVVICPANYLWEESTYLESVAAAKKRHPESRGMATMLADGIRAVDVLLSFPDVDPQRVGTIGHSLGGKEALYLLAFDDRVRAGIASEGGIGLSFSNWDAPWYLGPEIHEPSFPRNHHELLALIAPRPFLVLGGEEGRGCADGDRSWPFLIVGQQVSRLYGDPVQIGLLNHHQGHRLSPETAEKAFAWLELMLKRPQGNRPSHSQRGCVRPCSELDFTCRMCAARAPARATCAKPGRLRVRSEIEQTGYERQNDDPRHPDGGQDSARPVVPGSSSIGFRGVPSRSGNGTEYPAS
jgi:pimeloyl-ACP methyl ester carboxylesterase